jgi:serine O-acetyltransferase
VTLGGTGKERGDRHPKIRSGVLIGAGAKILGNVEIGEGSRIGASSVVLNDVPAHISVAGVPAKEIGTVKVSPPWEWIIIYWRCVNMKVGEGFNEKCPFIDELHP